MMKQRLTHLSIAVAATLFGGPAPAEQADRSIVAEADMKLRIVSDGTELTATLEDNAAARDFAALLPLDVTLSDYNGTEKVTDLPRRLSTDGLPDGVDPEIGDITYFAPWGNLALFYRDFGYARGLVRLGRIEGSVESLEGGGSLSARIERAGEPE